MPPKDPHSILAINAIRSITQMELNALAPIPLQIRQHQLLGIAMCKEGSQPHTIVGSAWFLAKCNDAVLLRLVHCNQVLTKAMAHHAIANHNNCLSGTGNHLSSESFL